MKDMNPLRRTIGLVLIMIGGIWIMLAVGMLESSFMTGSPFWGVVGGAVVVAGLAVLYLPRKKKPQPKAGEAPPATTS